MAGTDERIEKSVFVQNFVCQARVCFRAGHHCHNLHDDDKYQRHLCAVRVIRGIRYGWNSAFVGILAIGASLLMIAGEFDLSMGANIALPVIPLRHC